MNQLNSLILEGYVKSYEFKRTPQIDTGTLKIVSIRKYRDNAGKEATEESDFIVYVYGKNAELCEKNAAHNRGIRIVGRLKTEHYYDDKGKDCSRVVVIAEHIEYRIDTLKED